METVKSQTSHLCEKYNVRRLDVFGSVARGSDSNRSDIDFLVEFNNPELAASSRYFGLLFDLESTLERPVDLLTTGSLKNSYFRQRVLSERITIYER